MIHRPWLLFSAAMTVTIPGVLAILAILGHDHVAAETVNLAAASLGDTSVSSPPPEASAKTSTPVRNAIAAVQHTSGAPVTVDGAARPGEQALGLRVLAAAAQASQVTSYQGTEMMSETGVGGQATTFSQVWHSSGGLTLTRTPSTEAGVMRSPAGVFGLTRALVALLGKHYIAVYRGTSYTAVGRPAALVEVYRFDGSLAARFWLDKETLVPLRRELYDAADQPVGEDTFVQVRFGALTGQPAAQAAAGQATAAQASSAWVTASAPGKLVASLAGQGWRLPATLPDDLPLYAAAVDGTGAGEVIDLEYSDGLAVVSLFVQRGTLAPDMSGWRSATLGGHPVSVCGRSVTWSWHDLVFTMIADAPPPTVTDAVEALPRSSQPGVLGRFGRGLDRLAHLVDPFG